MNKVWQLQRTMSQGKPEPQQSLLHTHHPLTKAAHPSYVVSETLLPPYLAYPWQTQVFADSKPCPGSRIWPEKPGHCNKVINFKFMIKLSAGIPTCNKIQSHCSVPAGPSSYSPLSQNLSENAVLRPSSLYLHPHHPPPCSIPAVQLLAALGCLLPAFPFPKAHTQPGNLFIQNYHSPQFWNIPTGKLTPSYPTYSIPHHLTSDKTPSPHL